MTGRLELPKHEPKRRYCVVNSKLECEGLGTIESAVNADLYLVERTPTTTPTATPTLTSPSKKRFVLPYYDVLKSVAFGEDVRDLVFIYGDRFFPIADVVRAGVEVNLTSGAGIPFLCSYSQRHLFSIQFDSAADATIVLVSYVLIGRRPSFRCVGPREAIADRPLAFVLNSYVTSEPPIFLFYRGSVAYRSFVEGRDSLQLRMDEEKEPAPEDDPDIYFARSTTPLPLEKERLLVPVERSWV